MIRTENRPKFNAIWTKNGANIDWKSKLVSYKTRTFIALSILKKENELDRKKIENTIESLTQFSLPSWIGKI